MSGDKLGTRMPWALVVVIIFVLVGGVFAWLWDKRAESGYRLPTQKVAPRPLQTREQLMRQHEMRRDAIWIYLKKKELRRKKRDEEWERRHR